MKMPPADDAVDDEAKPIVLRPEQDAFDFLKAADRDYTEGEISSALVVQFLRTSVKECKTEIDRLKEFETQFYETDRDLKVEQHRTTLEAKTEKVLTLLSVLSGTTLGFALSIYKTDLILSLISAGSGLILLLLISNLKADKDA